MPVLTATKSTYVKSLCLMSVAIYILIFEFKGRLTKSISVKAARIKYTYACILSCAYPFKHNFLNIFKHNFLYKYNFVHCSYTKCSSLWNKKADTSGTSIGKYKWVPLYCALLGSYYLQSYASEILYFEFYCYIHTHNRKGSYQMWRI